MTPVSVVLPTYNRLDRLRQVLRALAENDYPPGLVELIVVSDGSTDGTNRYLQSVETPFSLTPILGENQGAAAARNRGLAQATGELVLFLDDDVVPCTHLISEHVSWHCAHRDVVVIGPMVTPPDFRPSPWVRWMHERLAEQYEAMADGMWEPTARQFYTGNASVARRHLVDAGGFDPSFKRAEDVELAYRLADKGLRFLFNPAATGFHYEARSYASWSAIGYAYGHNDVKFSQEKGQRWLLPTMRAEFSERHPVHRMLVHLCLDRSSLSKLILRGFRWAGGLGERLALDFVQRFAYSGVFNLRYYQGVADALGGRHAFWSEVC